MLTSSPVAAADKADGYDSSRNYAGRCDRGVLYWTDTGITPDCGSSRNLVDKRDFHCAAAERPLAEFGMFSDKLAQYRNGGRNGASISPYRWQFLAANHRNSPVECAADFGLHGDGRSANRWPAAGSNVSDPFVKAERDALSWNHAPRNHSYLIFDGNYLNWLNSRGLPSSIQTEQRVAELAATKANDTAACHIATAAPAVAVNPANRTQHLNEVYLTRYNIRADSHWPGELARHRIEQGRIVAENTFEQQLGGTAQQLPAPELRKLFSNLVANDLLASGNAIAAGNDALLRADLGLSGSAGEPDADELADRIRRLPMGDSMHSRPAAVVYGGAGDEPDTVVYVATNDGFLHAVSGRDGRELWAFMPQQLLPNLARLYFNNKSKHKHFGLDGDLVPVTKDTNGNGEIEAADGDFAYLVFGMRRGGHSYFALDVTDKLAPRILWTYDSYESGESWSRPSIARMHIEGASQNADMAVVVVGGGYDTVHDTASHPSGEDGSGAGIHILDLVSGERLWRAGMDAGADLPLNRAGREMDRAIPNQVRVIDLNGDGLADRMYASDLGGQLWRFDVTNGQDASELIAGGVIAQLGANSNDSPATAADTRRFYNAPDVSLLADASLQQRFLAISIGSGYRADPTDLAASDRFFSVRDPDVFTKLSQSGFNGYDIVTVDDLFETNSADAPEIGPDDRGWMYTLPDDEKILADSLTFSDQVFFVAFSPEPEASTACGIQGTNRLYRIDIVSGEMLTPDAETLQQTAIASSPVVVFPGPDEDCSGDSCGVRPVACIGMECFDPDFAAYPVRTVWSQKGID